MKQKACHLLILASRKKRVRSGGTPLFSKDPSPFLVILSAFRVVSTPWMMKVPDVFRNTRAPSLFLWNAELVWEQTHTVTVWANKFFSGKNCLTQGYMDFFSASFPPLPAENTVFSYLQHFLYPITGASSHFTGAALSFGCFLDWAFEDVLSHYMICSEGQAYPRFMGNLERITSPRGIRSWTGSKRQRNFIFLAWYVPTAHKHTHIHFFCFIV